MDFTDLQNSLEKYYQQQQQHQQQQQQQTGRTLLIAVQFYISSVKRLQEILQHKLRPV